MSEIFPTDKYLLCNFFQNQKIVFHFWKKVMLGNLGMKRAKKPQVLLIDDDPYICATLTWKIENLAPVSTAKNFNEGKKLLELANNSAIAIIDLHLGEDLYAGKKLLSLCRVKNIPCIVISSDENEQLITELYDLGATHFLIKRDYLDLLYHYVLTLIKKSDPGYFENLFQNQFITHHQKLKENIQRLWSMPTKGQSVHIFGPTGSGKSLLAEIYHQAIFADLPFVHLNCAEIPETLIESELFGHVKGAFSGAEKEYQGKISLANKGTLFLDEIGCLSLNLQAKLLKVIESKSFYPIGSNEQKKVHFTLITATWEDLFDKAKNNLFRLDLLQRITQHKIVIPPLKDRPEDIEYYISHWMKNYPRKFSLTYEAKQILKEYSFPGNFRELKSVLTQIAQSPIGRVDSTEIKKFISLNQNTDIERIDNKLIINFNDLLRIGVKKYLQKIEKNIVQEYYERHQHQVTPVLKDLKLSASSFYLS